MFLALLSFADRHPAAVGVIGAFTGLSAGAISLLEQLTVLMRFGGAATSFAAGALAFWITYRGRRKNESKDLD